MRDDEFYCVYHKGKVTGDRINKTVLRNGQPALVAMCPRDGTKMYKFVARYRKYDPWRWTY